MREIQGRDGEMSLLWVRVAHLNTYLLHFLYNKLVAQKYVEHA